MGLEQNYQSINIRPEVFPFAGKYQNVNVPEAWTSQSRADYAMDYPQGPPLELPSTVRREKGRANNGHGRYIYHIWGVNKELIPAIRTTAVSDKTGKIIPTLTETRSSFTRMPLEERKTGFKEHSKAVGIVPATTLVAEKTERMLPAISRQKACHMTTTPFWQYSGVKRKPKKPYAAFGCTVERCDLCVTNCQAGMEWHKHIRRIDDSGFVYPDQMTTPRYNEQFWSSVTSLQGNRFSKRGRGEEPTDKLPVVGFDGGVQDRAWDKKEGIRCGYYGAYSTLTLE